MAGTMYAMKPVFELDGVVEVPQCMYALPVIQRSDAVPAAQSADCPPGALQALETRQDAILARLERLKDKSRELEEELVVEKEERQAGVRRFEQLRAGNKAKDRRILSLERFVADMSKALQGARLP